AVPDRPDGVEEDAPLLIRLRAEEQRAGAQVESVENGVTRQEDAHEQKPEGLQVHGAAPSVWRPALRESGCHFSGRSAATVSVVGPFRIIRNSKWRKRTSRRR